MTLLMENQTKTSFSVQSKCKKIFFWAVGGGVAVWWVGDG